MTPMSIHPWSSAPLSNSELFEFESGIWTGKKPPFATCCVLRNTNFVDDGTLDFADVAEIEIEARVLERKTLLPGDIILERSGGGPTQPVGRVAFFDRQDRRYCFSNFTTRLRVCRPEVIDSHFLHLYLHLVHLSGRTEKLQRRTTGIRNLDFGEYQKVPVPLPSPPIQRAVAHVLLTVQEAKEARQRELVLERERKAALMEYLFTRGTRSEDEFEPERTLPRGWNLIQAGELIADGPQNGLYKHSDSYGSGTRILRINDFDNEGLLISSALNRVRLTGQEISLYQLRESDILINRVNSLSHLGKSLLVRDASEPTVFESNMMRLRVDEATVLPSYFFRHLQTESTRNYLRGRAKRAVAQSSVSQGDIRSIQISIPPLAEQQVIVDVLDACDRKLKSLADELALLQELFNALLEELMTGKVGVDGLIDGGSNG